MSFSKQRDEGCAVHSHEAEPSCVSMKSNASIGNPPDLSDRAMTSDPVTVPKFSLYKKREKGRAVASSDPSCVSMKSKGNPCDLSDGTVTSDPVLVDCNLTDECCESLASCLRSSNSLRDLDLSKNDLQDSGVKLISDVLKNLHCQLEILRLSFCMVTEEGCYYLASALESNPSHLRELDLSYNHPEPSGVQMLFKRLNDLNCTLENLHVDQGGEFRITVRPRNMPVFSHWIQTQRTIISDCLRTTEQLHM